MHQASSRGSPVLTPSLFWPQGLAVMPCRPSGEMGGPLSPNSVALLSSVLPPHWCCSSFPLKKALPFSQLAGQQGTRGLQALAGWLHPQADGQHETAPSLQASVSSLPGRAQPQGHLWAGLPQLLSSQASLRMTAGG